MGGKNLFWVAKKAAKPVGQSNWRANGWMLHLTVPPSMSQRAKLGMKKFASALTATKSIVLRESLACRP